MIYYNWLNITKKNESGGCAYEKKKTSTKKFDRARAFPRLFPFVVHFCADGIGHYPRNVLERKLFPRCDRKN